MHWHANPVFSILVATIGGVDKVRTVSPEISDETTGPRPRSGRAQGRLRALIESLHTARAGDVVLLPAEETRHLVTVRRAGVGTPVEARDHAGLTAPALLERDGEQWQLRLTANPTQQGGGVSLTVASAVPKGARADWMAEKLSELGVATWQMLACDRSVVLPKQGKLDRFERLAREAAKQSGRAGVMQIKPIAPPATLAPGPGDAVLVTEQSAMPLAGVLRRQDVGRVWVGPEGGWSEKELAMFQQQGVVATSLGRTVLRIETAAIAAAALAMMMAGNGDAEDESAAARR